MESTGGVMSNFGPGELLLLAGLIGILIAALVVIAHQRGWTLLGVHSGDINDVAPPTAPTGANARNGKHHPAPR